MSAKFPAVSRRAALRIGAGVGTVALSGAAITLTQAHGSMSTPAASGTPTDEEAAWTAQMDAYRQAGTFPAVQTNADGRASTVMVEIPKIDFTGDGMSSTLPTGPLQYIYRFVDADIAVPEGSDAPFSFVEIDWNTEGAPRGPGGSFSSPHFDFHFYMPARDFIMNDLVCVSSNGKTCDGFLTDYAQMRRFQNMPEAKYVPDLYRPDVGSAIPMMGLHLLDMTQEYTVEAVNHYPVLIYGTFDGAVVFAEASVTLQTLQDVVASPDHTLSYPFRQPEAFARDIDWPTDFTIEYLPETGGFRAGFTGFQHHLP